MIDTGQDFITRDLIGAAPIPDDEHRRLSEALFDVIESIDPARLETMTIADLLAGIPDDGPAMTVLRSRLEGTMGAELSAVSAADLDAEFGLVQATTYLRVDGGNDRLARALAGRLDVRTGTPVMSVGQDDGRVIAHTDHGEHTADGMVVAVPLPILRSPGFLTGAEPGLVDDAGRSRDGHGGQGGGADPGRTADVPTAGARHPRLVLDGRRLHGGRPAMRSPVSPAPGVESPR